MTRLLLLLACAVVAALLWPRRRVVSDIDRDDGIAPYDERSVALTYYWQTPAGVQPVVQVVPREPAG